MSQSSQPPVSLLSANYISMSEIVFSIQRDFDELKNEFNDFHGPIPKFDSRFGSIKDKVNLYQFYYEFVLTNQRRTWTWLKKDQKTAASLWNLAAQA
jgi:hypothetical protein